MRPDDDFGQPEHADSPHPPDGREALREQMEIVVEDFVTRDRDVARVTDALRSGGRIAFRSALDIQTRVLSPRDRDPKGKARMLADRHNSLCIGPTFVALLNEWKDARDEGSIERQRSCLETLDQLRRSGREHGFFILQSLPEKMQERLQARSHYLRCGKEFHTIPSYVITEAYGRCPTSTNGSMPRRGSWSADCHMRLPAPYKRARHILTLPRRTGDIIHDRSLVEILRHHPSAVALIEDLSCEHAMSHLGLAGEARKIALHLLEKEINPLRGNYPVEYVAAEIASLQGIECPDGQRIRLREDLEIGPIGNERSKFIFENSRIHTFATAYELVDRLHAILMEGDTPRRPHKIMVTWWVMIAKLSH